LQADLDKIKGKQPESAPKQPTVESVDDLLTLKKPSELSFNTTLGYSIYRLMTANTPHDPDPKKKKKQPFLVGHMYVSPLTVPQATLPHLTRWYLSPQDF